MPSYLSASIRLATSSLESTIPHSVAVRNSALLTANIKEIDKAFNAEESTLLPELAIPGNDGHALRFLGEHQDMPFYMVQTGKDLFKG